MRNICFLDAYTFGRVNVIDQGSLFVLDFSENNSCFYQNFIYILLNVYNKTFRSIIKIIIYCFICILLLNDL